MHAVDKTEPFFNTALRQRLLDLRSYVDDIVAVLSVEPDVAGMRFH